MPPKHDREYIAWSIIDLLSSNMVAKLAEIKAEKDPLDTARLGRTIALPDFTGATGAYIYGNRTSYPKALSEVLFVAPSRTQPKDDQGNYREDAIHFDIVIVLSGAEYGDFVETDLNLKIDRYYRAASEILFADKSLLSTVSSSDEISADVHDIDKQGEWLFQSADLKIEAMNVFTG